jgi:hypothetical protein
MLEVNDSHTWKMKTLSILCSPKLSDHKEFLHTRSKQETNPQFWSWPCSGAYTLDKCYWTQTLPNDLLDSVSGVQHLRFEWCTNRKHTSSSCQTNQIHSLTQVTWISCHFTTYPHLFVSHRLRDPGTFWKRKHKMFFIHYASVNSRVPIPPRATGGHLLTLSVPGVGQSQFYRGPGAGHLRTPGRPPGIWHKCFRKCPGWVHRERRGVCRTWLVRQGLEKLVDVFKGMFSQF